MNSNAHAKLINPNTILNIPKFLVSSLPPYDVIYVNITFLLSLY